MFSVFKLLQYCLEEIVSVNYAKLGNFIIGNFVLINYCTLLSNSFNANFLKVVGMKVKISGMGFPQINQIIPLYR